MAQLHHPDRFRALLRQVKQTKLDSDHARSRAREVAADSRKIVARSTDLCVSYRRRASFRNSERVTPLPSLSR
jgi:hypothetical protein